MGASRWRAVRHPGEGRIDRGCGAQWGRRLGLTIHLPPRINGRPHAVSLLFHPAVPLAPLEPVRRQRVYSYAILSRIRSLKLSAIHLLLLKTIMMLEHGTALKTLSIVNDKQCERSRFSEIKSSHILYRLDKIE